jgi:hypothetical protein
MRRAGLCALVLVGLMALAASAQMGCPCADATAPTCYTTFRSNEVIEFSLTVPVEYFWIQNTDVVPLITGWRVETPEGILVKHVTFVEPRGHNVWFTWDLSTDAGGTAAPGFYRIVVTTTSAGSIPANIEIVSCCCSPCWSCCWTPCLCRPAIYCPPLYGELRLELASAGTRSCCGAFRVTIYGEYVP